MPQRLVASKKLLKVINPLQRGKTQAVYAINAYEHLELPNVSDEMKQLWSGIVVPPDSVEFERALRANRIAPAQQEQRTRRRRAPRATTRCASNNRCALARRAAGVIEAAGEKKKARKRMRRIQVQNTHVAGFDFNIVVQATDK